MTNFKMSAAALAVMCAFSSQALAQAPISGSTIKFEPNPKPAEDDMYKNNLWSININMKEGIPDNGIGSITLNVDEGAKDGKAWLNFSHVQGGGEPTFKEVTQIVNINADAGFDGGIKFQYGQLADGAKVKAIINVANNKTLTGDIINQEPPVGGAASGNITTVNVNGGAWTGNLVTAGKLTSYSNENTVNLTDNATWMGAVQTKDGDVTKVEMNGTSTWQVTGDSTVTSLQAEEGTTVKVDKQLTLNGLHNSVDTLDAQNGQINLEQALLVVHGKANVANMSFANGAEVVLVKDADVTLGNVTGAAHAHFEDLSTAKLNIQQAEGGVQLTVDASLNNKAADQVVADLNNAYSGADAQFEIAHGDITDAITGSFKNDVASYSTTKNATLVAVGQMTTMTMMQWRSEADDMNQRMGELRNGTAVNGLWARTYGGKAETNLAENEYYGLQIGMDRNISEGDMGHWVGAAVSYTDGDGTYTNGTSDNYTVAITGYSTWMTKTGSYLDLSAKFGKLHDDFELGTLAGKYDTQAMALSAEMGHRFPITNIFFVEPQAALTYGHVFAEDYSAGNGVSVRQDSVNSYVARAGLMAGLQCPDNKGSVWVRASYLYDFDGESTTKATQGQLTNTIDQDFGGGWYELGLGATMNITPNLSGYADFEYVTGGEIDTPYRWNVGVRYSF